MSWQYRKSKKVGPIRFTASKRGISSSVGFGAYRVTRRADGSYQRTVRIPGTGIRNTTRIGSPRQPQSAMLGGVGVGVGFMLGRLLFWPLLIVGILLLIFAWKALLVWGLIITAIILTRRYMRQRQTVGAIAEDAFRERVFLDTIAKTGVNIRQPIDQAHTACQVLDTGVTFEQMSLRVAKLNGIPPVDAARFVGTAIAAYCPQHNSLMK
jgi:hypothetical protein